VYGTSRTNPIPDSTTAITTISRPNATRQDRYVVMNPPSSGADQRVHLLLRVAGEVAVDQRLHRGQEQRRSQATDDRPEDDDPGQALGQRHRQRADRVAEQAQHVRPLATDEVADLAADEDERGGHQRLEGDRRLHAADRGVQVVHHC
jgi:hypothetical protein